MDTKNYIFIVPNPIDVVKPGSFDETHFLHWLQVKAEKIGLHVNGEKVDFKTNDPIVQIWWTGSGSENWGAHGLPEELCGSAPDATYDECLERDFMIDNLPYRLIKDLKEGDTLSVEINGHVVEVVANQLGYRYKRFGTFEEVLSKLI